MSNQAPLSNKDILYQRIGKDNYELTLALLDNGANSTCGWIILQERGEAPEPELIKCSFCEYTAIDHSVETGLNYCFEHYQFKNEYELQKRIGK